nr:hypothetical protein CFP56_44798 [Quercus suber]
MLLQEPKQKRKYNDVEIDDLSPLWFASCNSFMGVGAVENPDQLQFSLLSLVIPNRMILLPKSCGRGWALVRWQVPSTKSNRSCVGRGIALDA